MTDSMPDQAKTNREHCRQGAGTTGYCLLTRREQYVRLESYLVKSPEPRVYCINLDILEFKL